MKNIAVFHILLFCITIQVVLCNYASSILKNEISDEDYNPDIELNTLKLIKRAGYPAEAHIVTTEDGYLLEIHRIPNRSSKRSVFLQHGFLGSSADWVIPGKEKSLAYILADRGYDVWLGNFRGNTYSRGHVSLSTKESKYWDFSWHEMGIYDLPAAILYIAELRKELLDAYIGYSMGTTAFYVMATEKPKATAAVRFMYSLAPVAYISHIKSPIRFFAPFANDYELIAKFLGHDEFLPQNSILKHLAKYGCDAYKFEEEICANAIFIFCGFDTDQFNYTLLPVILSHVPAGASTKTLVHYAQIIQSGRFQQYNYGSERNMKIYNSTKPPEYNLSSISIPIALFYSDNDWIANSTDVLKLSGYLKNKLDVYKVPFSKFNHVDFIWAMDAPKLLYERLLYVMNKYT